MCLSTIPHQEPLVCKFCTHRILHIYIRVYMYNMYIYTCTYMHIYTCTYIYICIYIYMICISIHTHICVSIRVYISAYICIHIWVPFRIQGLQLANPVGINAQHFAEVPNIPCVRYLCCVRWLLNISLSQYTECIARIYSTANPI